jgi:ribonuclease T2
MSSIGIGGLLAQIPFMHNAQPETATTSYTTLTPFENAPSCPSDGPISCHSNNAEASCCFVSPGGQLLQTQFWDTSPAIGPADSWTLHGLWYHCLLSLPPHDTQSQTYHSYRTHTIYSTYTYSIFSRPDLCDGTYDQFCTSAPQYNNITDILSAAGRTELLSYMNTFWLPDRGSAEHFWEHEWNKHGTCVNTLSPSCYGDSYTPGMEVVDFFERTVGLFKVCYVVLCSPMTCLLF